METRNVRSRNILDRKLTELWKNNLFQSSAIFLRRHGFEADGDMLFVKPLG
jgi:hypothetical protein